MASPASVLERDHMIRLFHHENMRVYCDRLYCVRDRESYFDLEAAQMRRHFKEMSLRGELMALSYRFGSFGNNENLDAASHVAKYAELPSFVRLQRLLEGMMTEFNARRTYKKLSLVLFESAVDHVCRIARIISQSSGWSNFMVCFPL
jgi:hypothetical protein